MHRTEAARKDVVPLHRPQASRMGGAAAAEWCSVTLAWDAGVLCEDVDSARPEGAGATVHVHEPGSFVPLLRVEGKQVFAIVNDHLGMPKELVDRAGRVAWRAQHGAWGNVVEVTRDPGAAVVASPFRLRPCAPEPGDSGRARVDRALALQGFDHRPASSKREQTEGGQGRRPSRLHMQL